MKNKCAICLRGKCIDTKINSKNNKLEHINYKYCIDSIFRQIIDINTDYEFDFYLHGWVNEIELKDDILKDYNPINYILELQKDFKEDYIHITNHVDILKERYKHLHVNQTVNYSNIDYNWYFQNILSYAYSISKAIELVPLDTDYEYVINLRYDVEIRNPIKLNDLNINLIYTDYVGVSHSPLFYGDFLYISNKRNSLFFKNFYSFLKEHIFDNSEYKKWVDTIIKNKKQSSGRFNHGIYSNQMIYAYFINKNGILHEQVISKFGCELIKRK